MTSLKLFFSPYEDINAEFWKTTRKKVQIQLVDKDFFKLCKIKVSLYSSHLLICVKVIIYFSVVRTADAAAVVIHEEMYQKFIVNSIIYVF